MGWDKQKIRLFKMLEPYSSWGNEDEEKHREAKEALCRFYDALKKCKPDKKYQVAGRSGVHMSYFPNLILVKKALVEQRYTRACHELGTLTRALSEDTFGKIIGKLSRERLPKVEIRKERRKDRGQENVNNVFCKAEF
ncbi:hypothetical protein CEB3_c21290 [Peptococcaceae bacterium CEB3]|nr:hypothetical protein CEB3_c21290 [Peptococcaceae bacterium CEB3]